MLFLVFAGSASLCRAQAFPPGPLPTGWTGVNIGGATGTNNYIPETGTFLIAGSGTGMSAAGDQMNFTSTNLVGDFQFTARIFSCSGSDGQQVGLAMRQNTSGTCAYAGGVSFVPLSTGTANRPNSFGFYSRKTTAPQDQWFEVKNPSQMPTPCWLRLVRVGNDFAAYKSSDGCTWISVYNVSGGAFVESGTIQVGFFATSGTTAATSASVTSGTIDNVSIVVPPKLAYKSSWIGNTFAAASTGYVSGNGKALWVSPDGTCYVNGAGDETGQSAKIYKNGQVVKRIDNPPTGGGWEGSVTGDKAGHIFITGRVTDESYGVFRMDANGANSETLYFTSPPTVANKIVQVSGMAYGNSLLYLSDPVSGKISVLNPIRNSYGTQPKYMINKIVTDSIDTSASTDFAPEAVYQSQFQADGMNFQFSGFPVIGNVYSVRIHFAELEFSGTGQRVLKMSAGTKSNTSFDVVAQAGGKDRPTFALFTDIGPDPTTGILSVSVKTTNSNNAIVSGIEIFSSAGIFKRYNCGGPMVASPTGDWESSINQIGSISLAAAGLTQPGPLAVDGDGYLWAVQEGGPFPTSTGKFNVPSGLASIKCLGKIDSTSSWPVNPTATKTISGLTNPTSIFYDNSETNNRLLVTEDGEDQNVKIYANLASATPACTGTFGATKGVFSGSNPGLVDDPTDHHSARFYGPTGVGVDSSGHLYVLSNSGPNITDLKAFSSASSEALLWKIQALEFCNVGDFDPTAWDSDIWTPSHHYTMDYSGTTPGGEWALKSYLWNPFRVPGNPQLQRIAAASTAVYRKIGATQIPVMYVAGQGALNSYTTTVVGSSTTTTYYGMDVNRFAGEQVIRAGMIYFGGGAMNSWTDTNSNGLQDEAYVAKPIGQVTGVSSNAYPCSFDVDQNGTVYFAMAGNSGTNPGYVYSMPCTMSGSLPTYSLTSSGNKATVLPTSSSFRLQWGNKAHLRYDSATDSMYLEGAAHPDAGALGNDKNFGGILERWDNWSTSPQKAFGVPLPDPSTSSNFQVGAPAYSQPDGFCYQAMDVANGYTFLTDLWGGILIVRPDGTFEKTKLQAGPEVSGVQGWSDAVMGLRAHYNAPANEYVITQENAGFHIRQNLYRWTPKKRLLFEDFRTNTNPFSVSAGTGGSTSFVAESTGNRAVQFTDSSVAGDALPSEFTWVLSGTHPLVTRINEVLSGTTPVSFVYQFKVRRSAASSSPVLAQTAVAYLQADPNDGNPPTSGLGRDQCWTGQPACGTLPAYLTSTKLIKIDDATFAPNPSQPWRGLRFTVTPDGTHQTINSLTLGFRAQVNASATPESFLVDDLAVDEVP